MAYDLITRHAYKLAQRRGLRIKSRRDGVCITLLDTNDMILGEGMTAEEVIAFCKNLPTLTQQREYQPRGPLSSEHREKISSTKMALPDEIREIVQKVAKEFNLNNGVK